MPYIFEHSFSALWVLFFIGCWKHSEALGSTAEPSLRFVHAVWRHGDRNPAKLFPSDNNTEATWPNGLGELTTLGMEQHYNLGSYIKQRYEGYLPANYSAFEIYVRSTDYNRTLTSALSNLAGMYHNRDLFQSNLSIPWLPIPVHTMPKNEEIVLWMDRPCPTVKKHYLDVVQKSPEVQAIVKQHEALFHFLEEKTNRSIKLLDDIWEIFDPLNVEKIHYKTNPWPSWMNETLFDQLNELYDISSTFYYNNDFTRRLRGGLLFYEIVDRMKARVNNTLDSRLKYYAYSAHDTTIIALLELLRAYDGKAPQYCATLFIELHELNGTHFVRVLYKNSTYSANVYPVAVEGCGTSCTLEQLSERSQKYYPTDWYGDCGIVSAEQTLINRLKVTVYVLIGVVALLVIAVISFGILLYRSKTERGGRLLDGY